MARQQRLVWAPQVDRLPSVPRCESQHWIFTSQAPTVSCLRIPSLRGAPIRDVPLPPRRPSCRICDTPPLIRGQTMTTDLLGQCETSGAQEPISASVYRNSILALSVRPHCRKTVSYLFRQATSIAEKSTIIHQRKVRIMISVGQFRFSVTMATR